MKTIAILGSGNGSNFEAIIRYFKNRQDIKFICISNKQDAFILQRARNLGVENYFVPFDKTYEFLKAKKFDLHVLAGYMKILSEEFLKLGDFINIHPSLLPEFKGMNAIKRAFESGAEKTGVTVHYVDEGIDTGKTIAQQEISMKDFKTLEKLEIAVHQVEHQLYPRVIEELIDSCILIQ